MADALGTVTSRVRIRITTWPAAAAKVRSTTTWWRARATRRSASP